MRILYTPIKTRTDPSARRAGGFVADSTFRLEEPGSKIFVADIAGSTPAEAIANARRYMSFGGRWEPTEVDSLDFAPMERGIF